MVDHGETWDSAIAKYGFDVPDVDLLPIVNPRDSVGSSRPTIAIGTGDSEASDLVSPPASAGLYQLYQGKEFESTPERERTGHRRLSSGVPFESSPISSKSSDTQPPQKKRKPLPGSRRDRVPHGTAQAAHSPLTVGNNPYKAVHALHLRWADESRQNVIQAGLDLEKTLRDTYSFSYQTESMPLGASQRQLKDKIDHFIENKDEHDVLKIIFYTGESYLDGDRNMMLAAYVSLPQNKIAVKLPSLEFGMRNTSVRAAQMFHILLKPCMSVSFGKGFDLPTASRL